MISGALYSVSILEYTILIKFKDPCHPVHRVWDVFLMKEMKVSQNRMILFSYAIEKYITYNICYFEEVQHFEEMHISESKGQFH